MPDCIIFTSFLAFFLFFLQFFGTTIDVISLPIIHEKQTTIFLFFFFLFLCSLTHQLLIFYLHNNQNGCLCGVLCLSISLHSLKLFLSSFPKNYKNKKSNLSLCPAVMGPCVA